jgi:hypothetical protein
VPQRTDLLDRQLLAASAYLLRQQQLQHAVFAARLKRATTKKKAKPVKAGPESKLSDRGARAA